MNRIEPAIPAGGLEAPIRTQLAGMRLHRCEFYNWGTFDGHVWGLELNADNTLLTGDIGSGKSTLVDAITTLLVPPQKVSYNKAAGADARERDLKSYVLGHYKSERAETGYAARPVALRDHNSYSVILARFRNDGFDQDVTLAQVFWLKELQGQPARFYVVADMPLSVTEHFTKFGSDFNALKKRLRALSHVEIHDTFPPYGAAFRRRFGIETEQALDLFHQTVSMKSVGNLTDFVRQHMLEAFPVDNRIDALMSHFDNLNRAHEAVLKAKAQIELLEPLVADCNQHAVLVAEVDAMRGCRDSLRGFFSGLKAQLLKKRSDSLRSELARLWEGAAERLLHNYALSLLVPDEHYQSVAGWVDRTHLGGLLVYFRVRERRSASPSTPHPQSLIRKLAIQPNSNFYAWLEGDLAQRFDYACCDSLDSFRREAKALTRAGQIKDGSGRHTKDDRSRLDDRTRYVLGWSNEAKIAALEQEARALEERMKAVGTKLANIQNKLNLLDSRQGTLQQLSVFESFRDLDWKPIAVEIDLLEAEKRQLEEDSDILRTLQQQLGTVEQAIIKTEADLKNANNEHARTEERLDAATRLLTECTEQATALGEDAKALHFPRLREMLGEADRRLTVESCDAREREIRERLQSQIDNESLCITRLRDKIVAAMKGYNDTYLSETREIDVGLEAAPEYRKMLTDLVADGLPRFEARFKELLNENTIREIANFQSQLHLERQSIRERIDKINQSLHEIDYNPNRFIVLEAEQNTDIEIRDFQQDLRACTEGTLVGSEETEYSEAKFLQVKHIIERFRGREGTTELDRRWTRKVTDVRNWFVFSASERWRDDGREHEHYTDSGGKSGGQKEKLAYTVLAASLAYQFGLEWGQSRSRSFRFVLIDEAFGRGSDESTRYGLELFRQLGLQLLIVTPLQKIHIIEPYVASVGFVHNEDGRRSMLRNLTIEEYRAEQMRRAG